MLPSQLTNPQQDPLPPLLHPKPHHSTVTSLMMSTATPAILAYKMTTWAVSSTWKLDNTLEVITQAVNDAQRPSTAQKTELHKAVWMHSSECITLNKMTLSTPGLPTKAQNTSNTTLLLPAHPPAPSFAPRAPHCHHHITANNGSDACSSYI